MDLSGPTDTRATGSALLCCVARMHNRLRGTSDPSEIVEDAARRLRGRERVAVIIEHRKGSGEETRTHDVNADTDCARGRVCRIDKSRRRHNVTARGGSASDVGRGSDPPGDLSGSQPVDLKRLVARGRAALQRDGTLPASQRLGDCCADGLVREAVAGRRGDAHFEEAVAQRDPRLPGVWFDDDCERRLRRVSRCRADRRAPDPARSRPRRSRCAARRTSGPVS